MNQHNDDKQHVQRHMQQYTLPCKGQTNETRQQKHEHDASSKPQTFSAERQSKDNEAAAHFYGELGNVQENERAAHFYGELRSVAASPYE